MLFNPILIFAGLAAAFPQNGLPRPGPHDEFGLIAIASGSKLQNTGIIAKHSELLVGGKQDAQCDAPNKRFATLYLKDGAAFLYTKGHPPQQLYVDRSGMGQGITGYTTGAQPMPKNGERKLFSINKQGYLVFDGMSPKACPTGGPFGAYSIWFSNLDQPGHNKGCISISLRAIKSAYKVGCHYSE